MHQLRSHPSTRLAGLLIALSTLLISACSTSTPTTLPRGGTYYGPAAALGAGEAQAFVRLDPAGTPSQLGVRMSEAALTQLPSTGEWEYLLKLPPEALNSGYDHVTIDWNPQGHIPAGVYDLPHFDVHFYLIPEAERELITAVGADLERAHKAPLAMHMPAGYILPPGTEVPKMGAHAIDPAGEEFNGKPFTKTFIYGFYDGQMIFVEPMFSLAYLQSRPDDTTSVAKPERYARSAYFPSQYGIRYNTSAQQYEITLDALTLH